MLNVLMYSMTILNTMIREKFELRICHLPKFALKNGTSEPGAYFKKKNVGLSKIEPETFHLLNEC